VTIWIDPPAWPAHGRLWSHLVSDVSYAELHDFAVAQGVSRRAFEGDHYDVPEERYAQLVAAGARPVGPHDLVRILRGSGLRIQKRTRERVVASFSEPSWLPPGSRVDVIASRQATPPVGTVVVRLATLVGGEVLLAVAPDGRLDLPSAKVESDDVATTVARLRAALDGRQDHTASLLGYVRHTVPDPDPTYPWPSPTASFAVYLESRAAATTAAGLWVTLAASASLVGDRDWWPLVAPLGEST
jgi:Protein of unknown function (DUF4031)